MNFLTCVLFLQYFLSAVSYLKLPFLSGGLRQITNCLLDYATGFLPLASVSAADFYWGQVNWE
jgi:hypothetical protein